jgi:hypothetical protein
MINEKMVTVGIKSFFRPQAVERTLKALVGHDFAEVIVADDSVIDEEKQSIFNEAKKKIKNFRVIELPFDVGLSIGRNEIVKNCNTEYILMLDDDQEIPSNIIKLGDILEYDKNLGGVSCYWREFGKIKCTATNLIDLKNYILRDIEMKEYQTDSGVRFLYADFIPNSTLFRINCLREIKWDPRFKIGREHLDFYLAHKRAGKWKFAVTPDVIIEHFPKRNGSYSICYRHNEKRLFNSDLIFKLKWKKKYIIDGLQLHPISKIKHRKIIHFLIKKNIPLCLIGKLDKLIKFKNKIKLFKNLN